MNASGAAALPGVGFLFEYPQPDGPAPDGGAPLPRAAATAGTVTAVPARSGAALRGAPAAGQRLKWASSAPAITPTRCCSPTARAGPTWSWRA